jgi:hypothetical protein
MLEAIERHDLVYHQPEAQHRYPQWSTMGRKAEYPI